MIGRVKGWFWYDMVWLMFGVLVWYGMIDCLSFAAVLLIAQIMHQLMALVYPTLYNRVSYILFPVCGSRSGFLQQYQQKPPKRTSSRQWFFGPRFVSWCLFVAGCFRDDGKQWEDAAWLAHESMRSNQLELDRVSQNPLMNRTIAGWPDLVFWVISGDDIW